MIYIFEGVIIQKKKTFTRNTRIPLAHKTSVARRGISGFRIMLSEGGHPPSWKETRKEREREEGRAG